MNIALYAIPMSTIAAGILFSFVQNMCTSNTNLIIRQNDQINFLLQRVIDLNKKINRLQLELNTNTSILLKNLKETGTLFSKKDYNHFVYLLYSPSQVP